jgi:hypothetical protein
VGRFRTIEEKNLVWKSEGNRQITTRREILLDKLIVTDVVTKSVASDGSQTVVTVFVFRDVTLSALMMVSVCFCEASVPTYKSTRRHNPEE